MNKLYKNKKWNYLGIISFLMIASCAKMDDYKKFAEGGEISYTGKIDSVQVFSGDERVFIQGLFRSDPKVTGCIIYWNSLQDSVVIPVTRTGNVDTMKQYISLPENLYNFQIHTFDALGNKSVAVYAVGRAYGDAYKASISNRLIISAMPNNNNQVKIMWRNMDRTLGPIGTEVEYTDLNNNKQIVYTDLGQDSTVLPNFKLGTEFSYTTLFVPDTSCIDTFKTTYQSVEVLAPPIEYNRTGWTAAAGTDYDGTRVPQNVLDNNITTVWHMGKTTSYPHQITIDMHARNQINGLTFIQRTPLDGAAKLIEIQVSDDNANWTSSGNFTLQNTGEKQFVDLSGAVISRYFRIIVLSDYKDGTFTAIAEINAYKR